MRKTILMAAWLAFVWVSACTDDPPKEVYIEILAPCDDVAPGDLDDVTEPEDGAPDTAPDLVEDVGPDLAQPDVPPVLDPTKEGETDGDSVIFSPEAFEGVFVYGIGTEPGSALAQVGNTMAGAIAIPAVVEIDDGLFVIRVFDMDANNAVPGEDGVIEAYQASILDDGRIKVDFGQPEVWLEIQLWQNCVYRLENYFLGGEPLYADSLLTWSALEHYQSKQCGGQGVPQAMGLNVHFLRRADANPEFLPRKIDPDSPFGFFQSEVGDDIFLNRMPDVGPFYGDGAIVYYLTDEFPQHLRHVAYQVVESWNDTLEDAAGNRPLKLVDGEPSLVPWDPRFRVILWDDSQSTGAIAPFIESPMTGEMFETDVIMWLGGLEELVEKYQTFFTNFPDAPIGDFQPGGVPEEIPQQFQPLPADWNRATDLPPRVIRRRAFPTKPFGVKELHKIAQNVTMSLGPDELAEFIVADFLTHEIGHNLGLRHNFMASIDRDHHPENETATSTMDYVVGMTSPGSYDRDAMAYGYGEGSEENGYRYCTDEDIGGDPGCVKWDYGHPILYALFSFDKLVQEYPPGTPTEDLEGVSQAQEWGLLFNRTRKFFNSEYEQWDPENPVETYMELVDRVVCATEDGEECPNHLWFRQQWALYTLYTKYSNQGEWADFPALEAEDVEKLLGHYYMLILDPNQPGELRKTIIDKLPTSNVEGAQGLLQTLLAYLGTLEEPTEDQAQLLEWVQAAVNS